MFGHSIKYAFKTILKNRPLLVWTLLFPLALGTFMFIAFGNIYEKDMVFKTIEVDVVTINEQIGFSEMIEDLTEGDEPFFDVKYCSEEEALEDLAADKIRAVIYEDDEIKMTVAKNDMSEELVKTVLDQYKRTYMLYADLIQKDPSIMATLINDMDSVTSETKDYYTEKTTTDGNQDMYINYFYAVLAMSMMFSPFASIYMTSNLLPNLSTLGMRRSVSASSKTIMAVSEFLIMWLMIFIIEVISYGYFNLLGIDFGHKVLAFIGVLFVGSGFGVSLGVIIGSIPKLTTSVKIGCTVAFSMGLGVMADLCASGIKDAIEHSCPIINRISPPALITDAFYSINTFSNYDRYFRNLGTLCLETVICLVISFILLRRDKSASL